MSKDRLKTAKIKTEILTHKNDPVGIDYAIIAIMDSFFSLLIVYFAFCSAHSRASFTMHTHAYIVQLCQTISSPSTNFKMFVSYKNYYLVGTGTK